MVDRNDEDEGGEDDQEGAGTPGAAGDDHENVPVNGAVEVTERLDKTVPGGLYISATGKFVDANGEEL